MTVRTQIAGLTPARTYHFRFRVLLRNGKSRFSQVVSLIVH